MSAAAEGVLVLGATNIPWGLDPAVRRRFERRIYIPLPDEPARLALLRIALGTTPHSLQEADLQAVARRTDGLSGADISVLVRDALIEPVRECSAPQHARAHHDALVPQVRDALMEPVREMQQATHFRQERDGTWAPCAPGAQGARRMALMEVPAAMLKTPLVTAAHFERAVRSARPTVGKEDLAQQDKFTLEFGSV